MRLDGFESIELTMRETGGVYLKTVACCLGLVAFVWLLESQLTRLIGDQALKWALAVAAIQLLVVLSLAVYVGGRRVYSRFCQSIQEQINPAMEARVMALALEGEAWSQSVPSAGMARLALEQCVAHALTGLKDSSRDRLAHFAVENGLASSWEKKFHAGNASDRKEAVMLLGLVSQAMSINDGWNGGAAIIRMALNDAEPMIRIEAAHALLRQGQPAVVLQVFRSVLQESLLVRTLLCGELKRHAGYLLNQAIPEILQANDESLAANCLEMLSLWKLALPSLDVSSLLERHRDRQVFVLLMALLPYCHIPDSIEHALLPALESKNVEVQCAAAQAAGRLKLHSLIPTLHRLSKHSSQNSDDARLASVLAAALAQMGAEGARTLESFVSGPNRRSAAFALEALENLALATA